MDPFFCSTHAWSFFLYARERVDTGCLAEIKHGLVHKRRIVIAIQATKRKRQGSTNLFDVLKNERAASIWHRQAFRPSSGNVGHHEAVHEVSVDLGAAAMFDEVDFEIAGQRILPVREGSDRHRTADRIAHSASASALPRKGLFPHVTQQPVNGGGACRISGRQPPTT
jgi:hypothetical protein